MAESVVSFAVETINKLLIEEARFLWGVKGKVEDLQKELEVIQGFLRDADAKREQSHAIGKCVAQLQDIVYDAEDVIERYILRVAPNEEQNIIIACACFVAECKWLQAHRVGTEIDGLKSSISNLKTSMLAYHVQKMNEGESKRPRASMRRPTYAHVEEDFVGREDDVKKLVQLLMDEKGERVVFIWGMGGSGKTSLVRKVIAEDEVKKNFYVAWACASQEYQVKDILIEILVKLLPNQTKEVKKMTDGQLFKALYDIQKEKKCLVVLDDIWNEEAWNSLRPAFPFKETRSKLLITTRDKKVANHIDHFGLLHNLQCLKHPKSWELLMKRVFPGMKEITECVEITEYRESLAYELLKKCGGLPLAIVVLGGLLAKNKWETVHKEINLHFGDKSDVSKVLALSYDDLPWHLKKCFLYLGMFPKDANIPATKVLHMWIAEGFVSLSAYEEGVQVEDVAEQYLKELVDRGMVQVQLSLSEKIKTCHLHDLMRDLCVSKAMQEGFLSTLNIKQDGEIEGCSSSFRKIRRLSVNMCITVEGNTLLCEKPIGRMISQLRNVVFFGSAEEKWKQFQPILNHCKFLRVLKLEDLYKESENLPDSVGDLVHLRFLSLARSWFGGLPQSMENLVRLEYLNLGLLSLEAIVPNVMWKMRRLRHLYLPICKRSYEVSKKLRLDTLKDLRKLRNFNHAYCDVKDIGKLTYLQQLSVIINEIRDGKQLEIIPQLAQFNLTHLQSSSFSLTSLLYSVTEGELSKLSSYSGPCKLSIHGIIEKLPEHLNLPQKVRKLVLIESQLKEDPMPILEKLYHLVVLKIGEDAFRGRKMVCSARGFRELRHLLVRGLHNLVELRRAEGAMPKLSILRITDCPKMRPSRDRPNMPPPRGSVIRAIIFSKKMLGECCSSSGITG